MFYQFLVGISLVSSMLAHWQNDLLLLFTVRYVFQRMERPRLILPVFESLINLLCVSFLLLID